MFSNDILSSKIVESVSSPPPVCAVCAVCAESVVCAYVLRVRGKRDKLLATLAFCASVSPPVN